MDVKYLQIPNLKEVISIWRGLPFKEKARMILKQFNKGI